jgi:D-beta-D-heptose 7-phosphate kinase/D-beta-D-heptose 1-phosphate adenosyltransferase
MGMLKQKHITDSQLDQFLGDIRQKDLKVAFTNGCFDLLHPGHIGFLAEARTKGDCLIVGLNTDSSVKKLKGPHRPINNFEDRITMLAGLQSVDYIIGFQEDTPLQLIKKINPEVLIKGGDYKKSEIVGAAYVESLGGRVEIIPFKAGYSSTRLINRIKNVQDS